MTFFLVLVGAVALLAGAIASVSGFGIGSLLTPLLAVRVGTKLAVAAVSVPHLAATGFRFWLLRKHVDRRLLLGFGLMSAVGGLIGDGARMPVYLVTQGEEIAALWPVLVTATSGAILGTVVGERIFKRVPEPIYRRLVAALLLALGVFMLLRIGQ